MPSTGTVWTLNFYLYESHSYYNRLWIWYVILRLFEHVYGAKRIKALTSDRNFSSPDNKFVKVSSLDLQRQYIVYVYDCDSILPICFLKDLQGILSIVRKTFTPRVLSDIQLFCGINSWNHLPNIAWQDGTDGKVSIGGAFNYQLSAKTHWWVHLGSYSAEHGICCMPWDSPWRYFRRWDIHLDINVYQISQTFQREDWWLDEKVISL